MSEGGQCISIDSTIAQVLTMYPATVSVFLRWRMHCVGCPIARFETISDACRAYQQPVDRFLDELTQATMARNRSAIPVAAQSP